MFWKPGENIEEAYRRLIPFSKEELEGAKLKEEETEDLFIRSVIFDKQRLIRPFMRHFRDILHEEDVHTLMREADERIAFPHYELILRLDKKTLRLTGGGNCFHIKMTVAAFPKTQQNVKEKVLMWLAGR